MLQGIVSFACHGHGQGDRIGVQADNDEPRELHSFR
jgi:hypothetical protein